MLDCIRSLYLLVMGLALITVGSFHGLHESWASSETEPKVIFLSGAAFWEGTAAKGQVPARVGDSLTPGTRLKTAKRTVALVQVPARALLKVKPESELGVERDERGWQVELLRGGLMAQVDKQPPREQFRVRTRTAVMGVRGTQFYASWNNDQPRSRKKAGVDSPLWACVREGEIEVKSVRGTHASDPKEGSSTVIVRAGEGIQIPARGSLPAPRPFEWTRELNWNMDPQGGKLDLNDQASLTYGASPVEVFYD